MFRFDRAVMLTLCLMLGALAPVAWGQLDFELLAQTEAEITLFGEASGDAVELVALNGDFNGDGRPDPVVSIRPRAAVPQLIVIWENPLPESARLSDLTDITVINFALGQCDYADITGDLIDDLLISNGGAGVAFGLGNGIPNAYVVPGNSNPASLIDLTTPPAGVVTLVPDRTGPPYSDVPLSIAAAGTFNSPTPDIVIGDGSAGGNGTGRAYVVYGESIPSTVNLNSLNSTTGVEIQGSALNEQAGLSVAGNFDINADGRADVAVTGSNPYVLFGTNTQFLTPVALGSLGSQGVTLTNATGPFDLGSPGDISSDTYGDLLLATAGSTPTVYLLTSSNSIASTENLANQTNFTDSSTMAPLVPARGRTADLNNDNAPDIVVAAPVAPGLNDPSAVRIVTDPLNVGLPGDFGFFSGRQSIRLNGTNFGGADLGDSLGSSTGVADITGDGFPDLVISAPGDDAPSGIDAGALLIIPFTPPAISANYLIDINDNGDPDPNEELVVEFDRDLVVQGGALDQAYFDLSGGGDSLGSTGFNALANGFNTRRVNLNLGTGTTFDVTGAQSGFDLSVSGFTPEAIVSRRGVNATDGGVPDVADSSVDLQFALIANSQTVDQSSGGNVGVTNSADAIYTQHTIGFSSSALGEDVDVSLSTPLIGLGIGSAMEIALDENVSGDGLVTINENPTLTMQYRDDDFAGQLGSLSEDLMRIVEIIEISPGIYDALPVQASQTLDKDNNLITVTLPLIGTGGRGLFGGPTTSGAVSGGAVGTFATLPIETVDERSIWLDPSTGGRPAIIRFSTGASVSPETGGIYTDHRIVVPNWEVVSTAASTSRQFTIRTANVFERTATGSDQGFPTQSGAVFTIEVTNSTSSPVSFTDDVNIIVQYIERVSSTATDIVDFSSSTGSEYQMRVVTSRGGLTADYSHVSGTFTQSVNGTTNLVTLQSYTPLTDSNGSAQYGVVRDTSTVPVELSVFSVE